MNMGEETQSVVLDGKLKDVKAYLSAVQSFTAKNMLFGFIKGRNQLLKMKCTLHHIFEHTVDLNTVSCNCLWVHVWAYFRKVSLILFTFPIFHKSLSKPCLCNTHADQGMKWPLVPGL
ncbi:hypothetical protein EXN66_Car014886 [Channa argus]|uniref:Uncharacterized protein n=1 Tax=Channa argus TaxID=215402 RepID=A0A6G1Q9V7_CHAAH|nr:hypothetical protein EXN66_Car014886 [Channa argus]